MVICHLQLLSCMQSQFQIKTMVSFIIIKMTFFVSFFLQEIIHGLFFNGLLKAKVHLPDI